MDYHSLFVHFPRPIPPGKLITITKAAAAGYHIKALHYILREKHRMLAAVIGSRMYVQFMSLLCILFVGKKEEY